jgi:D-glycero-alpha-D-manno-heptose-7-phosphate kinase
LEQIAREACEIEIDICKKPIGKQDQYIAAYGGLNKITFRSDGSVIMSRIPLLNSKLLILGSRILLFYTDKTRNADVILKKQNQNTEEKREILQKMKSFVPRLERSLKNNNFNRLGKLLHENWLLKKTLVGDISTSEIDDMYKTAMEAGALGGKICGAGGGGFLLVYVPKAKQDNVRSALSDYRELPFMLDSFGSRIIFNVRSYSTK